MCRKRTYHLENFLVFIYHELIARWSSSYFVSALNNNSSFHWLLLSLKTAYSESYYLNLRRLFSNFPSSLSRLPWTLHVISAIYSVLVNCDSQDYVTLSSLSDVFTLFTRLILFITEIYFYVTALYMYLLYICHIAPSSVQLQSRWSSFCVHFAPSIVCLLTYITHKTLGFFVAVYSLFSFVCSFFSLCLPVFLLFLIFCMTLLFIWLVTLKSSIAYWFSGFVLA